MEGFKVINNLFNYVWEFKEQVVKFSCICILGKDDFWQMFSYFEVDNIGYDLFKILIDIFVFFYFNQEIYCFLMDEVGLEIEKFIYSILLVLLIFGGMCFKIVCLYNVLNKFDVGYVLLCKSSCQKELFSKIFFISLVMLFFDVFFGKREMVLL